SGWHPVASAAPSACSCAGSRSRFPSVSVWFLRAARKIPPPQIVPAGTMPDRAIHGKTSETSSWVSSRRKHSWPLCEMPPPDLGKLTEVCLSFLLGNGQMYRCTGQLIVDWWMYQELGKMALVKVWHAQKIKDLLIFKCCNRLSRVPPEAASL